MAKKSNRHSDREKPKVTIDIEPNEYTGNYKKIVGAGILILILVSSAGIWANWKTIIDTFEKFQITQSNQSSQPSQSSSSTENKSEGRIEELESQIGEIQKNIRENKNDENNERVENLENKVAELTKIIERQSIQQDDKQAMVIALGNLQNAIVNGRQFTEPLILAQIIIKDQKLNEIAVYAKEGVASIETLKSEFEKLQKQIYDSSLVELIQESEREETSGIFNKLLDSTRAYVRVTHIEEKQENGSLENNEIYRSLNKGDLEQANRLWDKINENDKAIMKEWGRKLKNKIKVERIVTELILSLESDG